MKCLVYLCGWIWLSDGSLAAYGHIVERVDLQVQLIEGSTPSLIFHFWLSGGMVDARDLKSFARMGVWVRLPPQLPLTKLTTKQKRESKR